MEPAFLLAVAVLVGGVVASFVPLVPGAGLSLAAIVFYWWSTDYSEPGVLFLALALVVGLSALVLDYFSSVISARISGASTRTALAAGLVGVVALVLATPVGALLVILLTVFVLEYRESGAVDESARRAAYTTLGMLASTATQVLVTLFLLVGFLVSVLVL
ncbi:DUF456 domain-containing protein [Natronorarus salvus]|uniref:DUF456 domain-containing protein n=1 Tax=Natronorarus salvus TaxID=3117733 RepID=UPI002F260269